MNAGGQRRGDDRPGGGPDVATASKDVQAIVVVQPGEHRVQPGLAEDPARAKDEDIQRAGAGGVMWHGRIASQSKRLAMRG
jgi:hypothetical protein